jgi:hypothetical protein
MADKPTESETIVPDPVEAFKKGRVKREAKRKEVKVITEYVPPPPEVKAELPPEPEVKSEVELPPPPEPKAEIDVDSIVDRVTRALFEKMSVHPLPPPKTTTKGKAKAKTKTVKEESQPPATKYFGWC